MADHIWFCLCLHQKWPFYDSSDPHQIPAVTYHFVVPGCRCWAGSGPRASGKSPQESPDKTLWPPESWFHLHCWRRGEILGKRLQLSKYGRTVSSSFWNIFTLRFQTPAWLEQMIAHTTWRDLFYKLAEAHPDCLMLNFTVKVKQVSVVKWHVSLQEGRRFCSFCWSI